MEKNPSKQRAVGAEQAGAEQSLDEALNSLEAILDGDSEPPRSEPPTRRQAPPAQEDGQYTIPLLHDVVVPGSDDQQPAAAREPQPAAPGGPDEEACRRLVERLANEIEVIVQARIEAAIQDAAGDIRVQIRDHLDIMLPEILDELDLLKRRRRD